MGVSDICSFSVLIQIGTKKASREKWEINFNWVKSSFFNWKIFIFDLKGDPLGTYLDCSFIRLTTKKSMFLWL
jgi:hypothetical protein